MRWCGVWSICLDSSGRRVRVSPDAINILTVDFVVKKLLLLFTHRMSTLNGRRCYTAATE